MHEYPFATRLPLVVEVVLNLSFGSSGAVELQAHSRLTIWVVLWVVVPVVAVVVEIVSLAALGLHRSSFNWQAATASPRNLCQLGLLMLFLTKFFIFRKIKQIVAIACDVQLRARNDAACIPDKFALPLSSRTVS